MTRTASTREAAAALGVAPVTLQKYAQSRRVPFDSTPGGHRRFDVDELRRVLGVPPRSIDVVIRAVREWAARLPPELVPAWLGVFGSVARGKETESSDVDLFLVHHEGLTRWTREWGGAKADLRARVSEATGGRDVDLLDVGPDELESFLEGSLHLAEELDRDLVSVLL